MYTTTTIMIHDDDDDFDDNKQHHYYTHIVSSRFDEILLDRHHYGMRNCCMNLSIFFYECVKCSKSKQNKKTIGILLMAK